MPTKLFWKLGISYLLLPLLALLAVDFYFARLLRTDYERAGFEHLSSLMAVAQKDLPASDEAGALQNWVTQFTASGARVTLIDSEGVVLADSDRDPSTMENHSTRPEVIQARAAGDGRAVRHSDSINRDLLYLARTVPATRRVAILRLAIPLGQLEQAIHEMRQRMIGTSLLILLFALAGAMLFSRSLSSRVEELKGFSKRVADGDFTPVAAEHHGDEIADLTRAMNQTAGRLKETIGSLEAERNQSEAILASMVEGVAAISPEGRILFLNAAFCKELHVEAQNVRGRAMVEVIRQPDLISLVQKTQGTATQMAVEVTISTSGADRFFVATAAPTGMKDGTAVVLVLHDITELRRLERVRRDFVANVSHEFRTPLTAIQGFAETLLSGAMEDQTNNRRFVEIIREHSVRLARLTEDLLTLSRIEAGKLELNLQLFKAADLIQQCAETSRLKARKRDLQFATEVRENLPSVKGDVQRLAEVLQNLLDNAIQYTNPGGKVILSAVMAPASRHIVFSVQDTGIGIPQHEQQRIFERFYRVDAARSREVGGTGLGLSIARHLAEAHGGRIEVTSEAGHGSTFSLFLPAAE